jgi:hypothetical protein
MGEGEGELRQEKRDWRKERKNIMWQFDGAICVLFGATRMF